MKEKEDLAEMRKEAAENKNSEKLEEDPAETACLRGGEYNRQLADIRSLSKSFEERFADLVSAEYNSRINNRIDKEKRLPKCAILSQIFCKPIIFRRDRSIETRSRGSLKTIISKMTII